MDVQCKKTEIDEEREDDPLNILVLIPHNYPHWELELFLWSFFVSVFAIVGYPKFEIHKFVHFSWSEQFAINKGLPTHVHPPRYSTG